ncbi:MAG: hypothetical protein VX638_04000 [Chloroflexota bacterium]|nr:hypothetical protein [Chloroflexota bacterium]
MTQYDMIDPAPTVEEFRKAASLRIEAIKHAIGDIPSDRIRYHLCGGGWHGPHTTDFPLKDIIDLILTVKDGAYSTEVSNPRHAHEWQVWENVRLPDRKILITGVVAHTTNTVEHPELVAWRIKNYARLVGRETSSRAPTACFPKSLSILWSTRPSCGPSSAAWWRARPWRPRTSGKLTTEHETTEYSSTVNKEMFSWLI